ncbi:MAG: GDSL-type esterase/lipase family protein [Leptospiraceae bacterium]|nr:lipase [Leptospiraceae bacterium]MCK6380746.1 GDSL-type esterase/lipase family protein [Leptospiraceae bacterium]NUM40274.1 lipase [Leptospiraceae bacterium]
MANRLILFFVVFSLSLGCSSFNRIFQKDNYNYYSTEFQCSDKSGWHDAAKFEAFHTIWNLVRATYREENKKIKNSDVVIVGNSLVHLFLPELVKQEFPGVSIVQRGIGGDMSDLLIERISDNVLNLNPKTIIIEIGGNDLINGKCLSYLEKNILTLIEKIRKEGPAVKIIFISVPPTKNISLNSIVPVYNLFLSGLPKKFSSLYFVDAWSEMREKDLPIIKEEFTRPGDKIHFNEKGYGVWGRLIRPLL